MSEEHPQGPEDAHLPTKLIRGKDHEGPLSRENQSVELISRGIYASALFALLPFINGVVIPELMARDQLGPVKIVPERYFDISSVIFLATALGLTVAKSLYIADKNKLGSIYKDERVLTTHSFLGHEIIAISDTDPALKNPEDQLNALLVRLPRYFQDNMITTENSPNEDLQSHLFNAICDDIAERLRLNPNLRHVYLSLNEQTKPHFQNHPQLDESDIFEAYNLQSRFNESQQVVKLDRQEVLDIARDPFEMLNSAIEAIDDALLSKLYILAQESSTEKRHEVIVLILERIQRLLSHEIDRNFHVSYISRLPHDPDNPNARYTGIRRITPFTQLRHTDSGYFYVETDTDSGAIRSTALSALLKVSDQPIDEVLASFSQYKRAQLLYIVDQLLRTMSIEELFQKKPTIEELESAVQAKQIEIKPRSIEDTLIPSKIPRPRMRSLLKNLAITLLLYPAVHLANEAIGNRFNAEDSDRLFPGEYAADVSNPITDEFPAVYPIWHISSTIDTQGKYWIENVYDYFGSSWMATRNARKDTIESFPNTFDETIPHVKITRTIGMIGETRFDIPILQGTKLAAIAIENDNGDPLPVDVSRDKSGALRAYLRDVSPSEYQNAKITVYLDSTQDKTISSTSERLSLDEDYDDPHYNAAAQKLIDDAHQLVEIGTFSDFDKALAFVIQKTYEYGIDTEGNTILKTAEYRDDFINKAATLDKMHCNTANTLLALLSENKRRLYATGYATALVQESADEKIQDGFLISIAAHGFTIDENGAILDATPNVLSTEDKVPTATFGSMENAWKDSYPEYKQAKEKDKLAAEFKQDSRAIGELLLGLGGIYGAMQLSRILKKHMTAENRDAIVDNLFSTWHGNEHLGMALQFLQYISFGPTNLIFPGAKPIESPPEGALELLRKNIHHGRVSDYIQNPDIYEPKEWTQSERGHIRQIAAYILLHP